MKPNPASDFLAFLTGNSGDYLSIGPARYILVVLFAMLLAASIAIARHNRVNDPSQRTARNVSVWVMRLVASVMWWQGALWKLPFPVSKGFDFWVHQLSLYTVLPLHAALVDHVLAPGIAVLQPLVFLTEIAFATSLLLGLAVRFSGIVAVLFTAHLWLGLYNDPTEWDWTYGGIIVAHGMFAANEAGRCLGLDNLLRGEWSGVFRNRGRLLRAYLLAS